MIMKPWLIENQKVKDSWGNDWRMKHRAKTKMLEHERTDEALSLPESE